MGKNKKLVKDRIPTLTTSYKYYVVFAHETFELAKYFVDQLKNDEGQWYSLITPDYSQRDQGKIFYHIEDLLIPEQTVTTTTVDSTQMQMAKMWQDIKKDRGLDSPSLMALMSKAGAWCHSHVNMEAKPTGTDEQQWRELTKDAKHPKAMIILNQKGDVYCRILDPNLDGIVIEQPPIAIANDFDYESVDNAVIQKVIVKKPVVAVSTVATVATHSTGGVSPLGATTQQSTGMSGTAQTEPTTEFIFHYSGKH